MHLPRTGDVEAGSVMAKKAIIRGCVMKRGLVLAFCGFAAFGVNMASPPPAMAQGVTAHFFCSVAKPPYGEVKYYSAIFAADSTTYAPAMQNPFVAHVAARYDPDTMSGAICFGPYQSYREAADTQNEFVANDRRNGNRVIFTRWTYR